MMPDEYSSMTRNIHITVRSFYLDDQSKPEQSEYVWAYRITIENRGRESVQLMRRSWLIIDAQGRTIKVSGEGVVGEKPVLEAGEAFEYTSGTPLHTPSGFMSGRYHMMVTTTGEPFDVEVPIFSLDSPHQDSRLH